MVKSWNYLPSSHLSSIILISWFLSTLSRLCHGMGTSLIGKLLELSPFVPFVSVGRLFLRRWDNSYCTWIILTVIIVIVIVLHNVCLLIYLFCWGMDSYKSELNCLIELNFLVNILVAMVTGLVYFLGKHQSTK